ncbi:MAG: isopentenyl phosphate kinase, partial [Candidatus Diapherotrites archaeon]
MKELVLVKLGGSLITNKCIKEKARTDMIARLASEIRSTLKYKRLIVAHGGGSFPHYPAKKYRVNDGITNKDSLKGFCLTNDSAARLNRIVVGTFIKKGINAMSLQPSAFIMCTNGKIENLDVKIIKFALKKGLLVVPYGDAVLDRTKGITIVSTEQLLAELAVRLNAKRIVVAGIVDGV